MSRDRKPNDIYTSTEIESAIIQGDVDRFNDLIDDAVLDHRSDNDSTLLHKAAKSGAVEIAEILIERGIDLDAQDAEGATALHRAIEFEHADLATVLIENGADVTIEDQHGNRPLWRAVFEANYELSELLIEHGADPVHENDAGKSPLTLAREAGAEKFITLLEYTRPTT